MNKILIFSQYLNRQPIAAAGIVHNSASVNTIGVPNFNMLI